MIHFRGNRKNMADFVDSPSFIKDLNEMIKSTGAKVTEKDAKRPIYNYKEFRETGLTDYLKENYSEELATKYLSWWNKTKSFNKKTNYWDLMSTCTIKGKKGILLVQTKSSATDLLTLGLGRLQDLYPYKPDNENDLSIKQAIAEANTGISKQVSGIALTTLKCYQLSNRIANAWWLANNGIPAVLLYKGELNGQGPFYKYKKTFNSDKDWQDQFIAKAKLIGADTIIDKWIDTGSESFTVISRSMEAKK